MPGKLPPTEVIGVSGDAKYMHLREPAPPTIYTPYWNEDVGPGMTLVVRSADNNNSGTATTAAVHQLFRQEAGRMPYVRTETADTLRAATTRQEHALTWLLGGLAALALIISATGITGLLAYTIQQRRKEIGVRMALGETPASIQRALIARAMSWVAAGLLLGAAATWPLRNILDSFLFRSSAADAGVWAATLLLLLLTTSAAAYFPALRASRTKLMDALRSD
jgi:putative ABC transport system permease protein